MCFWGRLKIVLQQHTTATATIEATTIEATTIATTTTTTTTTATTTTTEATTSTPPPTPGLFQSSYPFLLT